MIVYVLVGVRRLSLRVLPVVVVLASMLVPTVLLRSWQQTATADACAEAAPTTTEPSPSPSCPPPPRQPPAPDPAVHVTNTDSGRTVHLTAGQQLVISLTSDRPGDVWQGPDRSLDWLTLSQFASDSNGMTATLDATGVPEYEQNPQPISHGPTTVNAVTDTRCAHDPAPCDYTPKAWSLTLYVDISTNPARNQYETCQPASDTPTARIDIARYAGGTVAVGQGSEVDANVQCQATDVTVPRAGTQLFREQASLTPGGQRAGRFVALRTGDTTVTFDRDRRCAHEDRGEPICSPVYSTPLTPTTVGLHVASSDDASCVTKLATTTSTAPYGRSIGVTGSATPGSTVAVWFRRFDTDPFTPRRSLIAVSDGSFATSYVADGDYFLYATAGHCTTPIIATMVTPVISGPRSVRTGSRVTLTVHAPGPYGEVDVAFRRVGATAFSTRRFGFTNNIGVWTTTYRADADYRYYATYVRFYTPQAGSAYTSWTRRQSNPGLTQAR